MVSDPVLAAKAALDALGRPTLDWTTRERLARTSSAIAAWEAAHPDKADEHRRLCAELQRAEDEALERYRARRLRPAPPSRTADAAASAEERESIRRVRTWLESGLQWCLVLGPVGSGKSVAAEWACQQVRATQRSAERIRAVDFAALSTWDDAGTLDRLERASLLALDDLGVESDNGHVRAQLAGMLDARHERGLRTLITSNLSVDDVKRRLGERIVDRMRAEVSVVRLTGASLRGAA